MKKMEKPFQYIGIFISLTLVGLFKKHTKDIHFCEFSPNGNFLITGSTDGTAKLWNMEIDKGKDGKGGKLMGLTDERLKVIFDEKTRHSKKR